MTRRRSTLGLAFAITTTLVPWLVACGPDDAEKEATCATAACGPAGTAGSAGTGASGGAGGAPGGGGGPGVAGGGGEPPMSTCSSTVENGVSMEAPANLDDLPARAWGWLPMPEIGAGVPGSKHTRMALDSKRGRVLVSGGDYQYTSGNENGRGVMVWSVDLASGYQAQWTLLHGPCAKAGGVQPARPDNVTWVYDSTRDEAIVMPSFFFGATPCEGVTEAKGLYVFDLTNNVWKTGSYRAPPDGGYGSDYQSHFGAYDPKSDAIYRFYWHGNDGNSMQILHLGQNVWERIDLPAPHNTYMVQDQPAIDVEGGAVYAVNRGSRAILRYSIADKAITDEMPLPDEWLPPIYGDECETNLVFDSRNRVLLLPENLCYGRTPIAKLYIVDPATKEVEAAAVPPDVSGNSIVYDEQNNVVFFRGRSDAQKIWLYRYGC